MSEEVIEWNGANQYYYQFYMMESSYHQCMAARPPDIKSAYAILSQIYDRAAFAFSSDDRKRLEDQFKVIRERLYREDYMKYGFLPSFAKKALEDKQTAIDELRALQRDLFDMMYAKQMIVPKTHFRDIGYTHVKAGGNK